MDLKRRELLGGATLAAAWAAGGVDIANDAFAASAPAGKIPGGDHERNKRLLRERSADAQMHALPSELPYEAGRSAQHTSELQSLMRISYAVFCLPQHHK